MDAVIIGGGVVGLSCAYSLSKAGYSVAVLERRSRMGEETSTHNSGVIHAGIYYPANSLKAKLCVEGRKILQKRLPAWKIPYSFCGKLILTTEASEVPVLEKLLRQGLENGVADLKLIDAEAALAREPNIQILRINKGESITALLSPSSGVFDIGEYIRALEGRAQTSGVLMIQDAEVVAVDRTSSSISVMTNQKGRVTARFLVNAAGLDTDIVADLCGEKGHKIYPCRGEYTVVIPKKAHLIRGLVYPVPGQIALGVHLTKTIYGELWIGPNARFIESKSDYESNRRPVEDFYLPAAKLCPSLAKEDLRLGISGIRPKRSDHESGFFDFHIARQTDDHRIIHLIGIESPGLTASPAIGNFVTNLIQEYGN